LYCDSSKSNFFSGTHYNQRQFFAIFGQSPAFSRPKRLAIVADDVPGRRFKRAGGEILQNLAPSGHLAGQHTNESVLLLEKILQWNWRAKFSSAGNCQVKIEQ